MNVNAHRGLLCFVLLILMTSQPSWAIFVDGEGHYAIQPKTVKSPAAQSNRGLYQATRQSFRLLTELRATDQLSLNLEWGLFANKRQAYLGDEPQPNYCTRVEDNKAQNYGQEDHCSKRPQDESDPQYKPYDPFIEEAFVRYSGWGYCLLEVGRRSRHWGLGAFLNQGHQPFDSQRSVFDGIGCDFLLQKHRSFGFSLGIDWLAETGTPADITSPQSNTPYGATRSSDDLTQIYVGFSYDNRNTASSSSVGRAIGFYVSNVLGKTVLSHGQGEFDDEESVGTDVKFVDFYTALFWGTFEFRNELLIRLGNSASPSWARYGGFIADGQNQSLRTMKLNSMATVGDLRWYMVREGSLSAPPEHLQGDKVSHSLFLEYAYVPGDQDGYYDPQGNDNNPQSRFHEDHLGSTSQVHAIALHRNYKPALILFNMGAEEDDLRIDGVFDPDRVMNTVLLATGYDYQSLENGNFKFKLITARLISNIPQSIKESIQAKEEAALAQGLSYQRPIGFAGKDLGIEIDLGYSYHFSRYMKLGTDFGLLIPGSAWKLYKDQSKEISMLLQGTMSFNF